MDNLSDEELRLKMERMCEYVAKPIPERPWKDPEPALLDGGAVLIGSKYHAADVDMLLRLGVTAVLNCASGGISRLPLDKYKAVGIRYAFTNVRQDHYSYPILHDKNGKCSKHLEIAKALYADVEQAGGKALFFCVAGQNRSPTLAIAVMMLFGHSLQTILEGCAKTRPFILENVGFQQQLIELEALLASESVVANKKRKLFASGEELYVYDYGSQPPQLPKTKSEIEFEARFVEIELLVPGLLTMDVKIPVQSSIATVKKKLVEYVNKRLLSLDAHPTVIAKSWVVLAMFGYDPMYDFPLEEEAIELNVQLDRMRTMFGLEIETNGNEPIVHWNEKCRFAVVILSVNTIQDQQGSKIEKPWTFVHEERPGAPATLLENTLLSTHLRAWDFETGQAFSSNDPIVFSFANDPRDKRAFMKISTSAQVAQQFHAPGEGGILGMGANAIVHRVALKPTSTAEYGKITDENLDTVELSGKQGWDSAVKRPFSLSKMLASLETSSEACLAKRLRLANSLNSDGRVLYFYGLGVGLSSNAYNHEEYKFEIMLLSRYQEKFASYTMTRFLKDYTSFQESSPTNARMSIHKLQRTFTLIKVKVLLVSLLNAFRDLTLMGVEAFDFNHLNNVLVSLDHRTVRLIDIDGNSKGSIHYPSKYKEEEPKLAPHKPCLDIDLNSLLPLIVQQLILGKGRGKSFVTNTVSEIWRAKTDEAAKAIIANVIQNNFYSFPQSEEERNKACKHVNRVAEWFFALLKKNAPWTNWTNDIYDAMRCIDHLPIT